MKNLNENIPDRPVDFDNFSFSSFDKKGFRSNDSRSSGYFAELIDFSFTNPYSFCSRENQSLICSFVSPVVGYKVTIRNTIEYRLYSSDFI